MKFFVSNWLEVGRWRVSHQYETCCTILGREVTKAAQIGAPVVLGSFLEVLQIGDEAAAGLDLADAGV